MTCSCGTPTRDNAYVCDCKVRRLAAENALKWAGTLELLAKAERAERDAAPRLCAVCSSPLPEQTGPGRRRKVCPDEDSPTPGGCARWRHNEQRLRGRGRPSAQAPFTASDREMLAAITAAGHGYTIE